MKAWQQDLILVAVLAALVAALGYLNLQRAVESKQCLEHHAIARPLPTETDPYRTMSDAERMRGVVLEPTEE